MWDRADASATLQNKSRLIERVLELGAIEIMKLLPILLSKNINAKLAPSISKLKLISTN